MSNFHFTVTLANVDFFTTNSVHVSHKLQFTFVSEISLNISVSHRRWTDRQTQRRGAIANETNTQLCSYHTSRSVGYETFYLQSMTLKNPVLLLRLLLYVIYNYNT